MKKSGQAMVEYLVILGMVVAMGVLSVRTISEYLTTTFGNFAHVLSTHLTVGVCREFCFYRDYKNGQEN